MPHRAALALAATAPMGRLSEPGCTRQPGHDAGGCHEAIRCGGRSIDGRDRAGGACSRGREPGSVGRRPPARPEHLSAEETVPAGQLCDFTYHNEFTLTTNAVIFPDGTEIDQDVINAAHTNVATGFALH